MNIEYVKTYIKSLFDNDGLPDYFVIKPLRKNIKHVANIKTIGKSYFMYKFKTFEYGFGKNFLLVYASALYDSIINMFNNYYTESEKEKYYIRLIINNETPVNNIIILLSALYKYSIENIKPDHDCCHQYMECSDAGHCITQNKEVSIFCSYRKKLD